MANISNWDVIVVGSGPASVAALDAAAGSGRVAVLTGAVPASVERSALHPKIQAVAAARGHRPGVAERVNPIRGFRSRPLFSTAIIGGLANYWGQQVVRMGEADLWPRDAFETFTDYERSCDRVERLFTVTGGERSGSGLSADGFDLSRPRLLTGAAKHPHAALGAMEAAFEDAASRARAQVISARVHSIAGKGKDWHVRLDNGDCLAAPHIFLAAGVIGDGQILSRSFEDLSEMRVDDHTPWMLFTTGARRIARDLSDKDRAFNVLTLQRITGLGCNVFASFYDMRGADLNLLLASTLGMSHSALRGWPVPPGTGLVTPIQVWTSATFGSFRIALEDRSPVLLPDLQEEETPDPALGHVATTLKRAGVQVWRMAKTQAAFGFHYHNLNLRQRDDRWTPVTELLNERTQGAVSVVDAASLRRIGCQPHTLTMMARASALVRRTVGSLSTQ